MAVTKRIPNESVVQLSACFQDIRLPAGVSLFFRRWTFLGPTAERVPRFRRSAQRFFIISDSRCLPAGVIPWVRFVLSIPLIEGMEAPSSAAMALFKL